MTKDEEIWVPEEHPVPRPHMEECGSFPEGCCPWMPEPCVCQCTCDDLISAYNRGVRDELERQKALSPNRHEMGVMITRLSNCVAALEEIVERLESGDDE